MAEEKKPAAPAPQAQAATPPPRPAPPPAPRPAPPPAQLPPSKPKPEGSPGRRNLLKVLFTVGAILSIVPFVPWGRFLSASVSGSGKKYYLQKVVIDNVDKYGPAAGQAVNVNDLTTFPVNSHWVVTYPSSGDATLDAENPDTFQKYELIRLPAELGGSSKKATDFVAYSKVCVHLWCSPNYNPADGHQQYECPCHGSIYQLPQKDPNDPTGKTLVDGGKAIHGPASLQPFPNNAIPMLTLQADSNGNLYIFNSNSDPSKPTTGGYAGVASSIEANGELGFGRDFASYQNFIVPSGQIPADLKGLTEVVPS